MKESDINKICEIEFQEFPRDIIKKTVGMCNEVYEVIFEDRSLILRMNKERKFLCGTCEFLPLFKQLDIQTPDIVADNSSSEGAFLWYQFLTKLDGEDIGEVIESLSETELKEIAIEISQIFDKFNTLPEEKTFGDKYGEDEYKTLLDAIENQKNIILERNSKTGVVSEEILNILDWIINEYKEYFLSVKPKLYYDDICSKNVIIYKGKFNGLVDLDFLMKGDYLEVIGRIAASWHGTDYGKTYTEAVMKEQNLDDEKKKVVKMYAILNLIDWLSEEGIEFNSNTSGVINLDNVKDKEQKIVKLFNELKQ